MELISRGSSFEVFKGLHKGRWIAVKLPSEEPEMDPVVAEELLKREYKILKSLKHPNIIKVQDWIYLDDGRCALYMEFVEGQTLEENIQRCQRRHNHQGARRWDASTREILRQLGAALGYLHERGILHNDIKPQNIRLRLTAEKRLKLVLLDFGASGSAAQGGTLRYTAYERLRGRPPSERSEVFSLAVLIYYMLSGAWPYHANGRAEALRQRKIPIERLDPRVWNKLPKEIRPTLRRALSHQPWRRPLSVRSFLRALGVEERGRPYGFLLVSALALTAASFLSFPLMGGRMSQRMLERSPPSLCTEQLQHHSQRICEERRSCQEALMALPVEGACDLRVKQLVRCQRGRP